MLTPSSLLPSPKFQDGHVRVWDIVQKRMQFCLSGHTKGVTCVKWGGNGLLYTAAQDTTIKVWRASDGALVRTLSVGGTSP